MGSRKKIKRSRDEKTRARLDQLRTFLRKARTVADIQKRFGVSRSTVYRWFDVLEKEALANEESLSTVGRSSPRRYVVSHD